MPTTRARSRETELPPQLCEFLSYLGGVRRLSVHTVSAYRLDLGAFHRYCRRSRDYTGIAHVPRELVQHYVGELHRRKLAARSIRRAISAIRSFYHFLHAVHGVENPACEISVPKQDKKLPRALDADQVIYLLESGKRQPDKLRDYAMMELMYSCGLRVSELTALDVHDIEWERHSLSVVAKGGKTRNLPMGAQAANALKLWLRHRKSSADEEALFLNRRGKRISTRGVQLCMQRYGAAHGLHCKLSPHMLRHSFATHMLESGCDLRSIQEILGHEKLATTQVYTRLDFQHLATTYDRAHPRSKEKKE